MTIDEALALVDDIISHIWDRSIGAQEDVDKAQAVEVLAEAAREYREIQRYKMDVSSIVFTAGPTEAESIRQAAETIRAVSERLKEE